MDFLEPGESVDTDHYLEVLQTLKEHIHRKRPFLSQKLDPNSPRRNFIIHHDNASPTPQHQHLHSSKTSTCLPTPYSPDIATSGYFLFPRLKAELAKHKDICNLEQLCTAVRQELHRILKEDFCGAIRQLALRWMKCLAANGSYFEGRHLYVDPADHGLEDFFQALEQQENSTQESDSDCVGL